jgi:hypothetical protein
VGVLGIVGMVLTVMFAWNIIKHGNYHPKHFLPALLGFCVMISLLSHPTQSGAMGDKVLKVLESVLDKASDFKGL